jgi:hypothetical protein
MRIVLGGVIAPRKDPGENSPLPVAGKKGPIRDRRKNKVDRRRSVRDGVFVTLSTKKERRSGKDRRKRSSR